MIRKIIKIDEEKCNGCGLCAKACHEGAIGMVNGKAKLLRDDYCDGLGDCLPVCPVDAISFEEREAAAYDEAAVKANMANSSALTHWPVQIKLAPINAPYFDGADLLIAADCCAYAYGNFHNKFMKDKKTLVGCPKLDMVDYSEKLTAILANNDIKSITLTRMVVPCCGGMEYAVKQAIAGSGKDIPLEVVTIGIDGNIM
ncbi:MAG: 4Fe-4S binding protein [Bacillota bacterium]|nr:4Fe-4S binding protein [Bacillota bacterium]